MHEWTSIIINSFHLFQRTLFIKAFDFLRIANSVPNKGKSSILPLFNGAELLSSTSDKAKLFAETFSDNSKS